MRLRGSRSKERRSASPTAKELRALAASPRWVHSVIVARFDAKAGAELSASFPGEIGAVPKAAITDWCFPDGAHAAEKDTVFWAGGGGGLYAVACYGSRKRDRAERGAVQRGLLVLLTVPLLAPLCEVLHRLLSLWLERGAEAGAVEPTSSADATFAKAVYDGLATGLESVHPLVTKARCSLSFRVDVPAEHSAAAARRELEVVSAEVSLPFWERQAGPQCSLSDALSYGCSVKLLLTRFGGRGVAQIQRALLQKASVLFHTESAEESGRLVLACVHLIRPLSIPTRALLTYVCVDDAERLSRQRQFVVAGTTNHFVASQRNCAEWVELLCTAADGTTEVLGDIGRANPTIEMGAARAATGLREGMPECWLRGILSHAVQRAGSENGGWVGWTAPPAAGFGTVVGRFRAQELQKALRHAEEAFAAAAARDAYFSQHFQQPLKMLAHNCALGSPAAELASALKSLTISDVVGGPDESEAACGSMTLEACERRKADDALLQRRLEAGLAERLLLMVDALQEQHEDAGCCDRTSERMTGKCGRGSCRLYALSMQAVLWGSRDVDVTRSLQSESDKRRTGLRAVAAEVWIATRCIAVDAAWRRRGTGSRIRTLLKSGTTDVSEVIPYDVVQAVYIAGDKSAPEAVLLLSGGVELCIRCRSPAETTSVCDILQILVGKQRRTKLLVGHHDPMVAPADPLPVPEGLGDVADALFQPTRNVVIPAGQYQHCRDADDVVVVPGGRDTSEPQLPLPKGWRWTGEWTPTGDDRKSSARTWRRRRTLCEDADGEVLPAGYRAYCAGSAQPGPIPRDAASP